MKEVLIALNSPEHGNIWVKEFTQNDGMITTPSREAAARFPSISGTAFRHKAQRIYNKIAGEGRKAMIHVA